MLNSVVDAFHSFASSVELADGLRIARREFVTLRGDLFDSDSDYEARLGVFLDWFLCDRKVRIGDTTKSAASYFIDEEHPNLSSEALAYAEAFRDSSLRLLLFKASQRWKRALRGYCSRREARDSKRPRGIRGPRTKTARRGEGVGASWGLFREPVLDASTE